MKIKPNRLKKGDKIAILAPASPPSNPYTVRRSIQVVSDLGFKPIPGKCIFQRHGYLAGSDEERAEDLMNAFKDTSIAGIFFIRGGYGCARLLPLLDFQEIKNNPKVLLGFSDITSLHLAINKMADLVTFHGPNIDSAFIEQAQDHFTVRSAMDLITSKHPDKQPMINEQFPIKHSTYCLKDGVATGEAIAGNLTVMTSLMPSPYQADFEGKVLFIEDVNEAPYRIDRCLTQLKLSGIFNKISGLVLGQFSSCDISESRKKAPKEMDLHDVFLDRLKEYSFPVLANYPFGHVTHNLTIPCGVSVTINSGQKSIFLNESPLI